MRDLLLACAMLAALPGCGRLMRHASVAEVTTNTPAAPKHARRSRKAHATPAAPLDATGAPDTDAPSDPLAEARAKADAAPAEPYWPYRVAELELGRDSSAAAERALTDALKRDHDYAPALALLSKLDYQNGRNLDAIGRLEAARQRASDAGKPFPAGLTAGLALNYDAIDRVDRAAPLAALLPEDGSPDERTTRVFLRLRGPAPDSAAALAEQTVKDRPKGAADQNNYGITRLRAGDPDRAREAFLRAIQLDASLPGPYYNLAILEKFYRLDDDGAAKWYAEYRARSNDDPDGLARVFAAPAAGNAHAGPEDTEVKP
jgi:Tfp pilus assembly protein PilF